MASDMAQLPVTADNIQQAIRLMYGQANPNPEATQAASRWLTAAKASPQAWDFLWVLLMPDKVSRGRPHSPHTAYTLTGPPALSSHCLYTHRT